MRLTALLLMSSLAASVDAAEQPHPPQSAPSPAQPRETEAGGPDQEPEVTITTRTEQTVEEYRIGGRLYMIKITPKHGKPYYLIDDRGDGRFARQEGLDQGVRPPRWVIKRF